MGGVITKRDRKSRHLHFYFPQIKFTQIKDTHNNPKAQKDYHYSELDEKLATRNSKNLTAIHSRLISKTIKNSLNKQRKKENIANWKSQIASSEEIIKDLASTIKKSSMLFVNREMATVFNIKAIEGHAENGHATFEQPYQNTTTPNVIDAIAQTNPSTTRKHLEKAYGQKIPQDQVNLLRKGFTRTKFLNRTQGYTDSIVQFQEDWLKGIEQNISKIEKEPNSIKFKNNKKKTLNGMSCFKGMEIYMLGWMRRFYLTTQMDAFKLRNKAAQKYGYQMGGGESHLGSIKKLQEYGANISDFSKIQYQGALEPLNHVPHKTRLKILENLGIIKTKTLPLEDIAQGEYTWERIKAHPGTTNMQKNPNFKDLYVREKMGHGIGDDIAIFLGAFLPPSIYENKHKASDNDIASGIMGGLSGDHIDTVSKDSKLFMPGGQDWIAGLHINGLYKRLARDKRFRKKFGIKERPDGDYNLVNNEYLINFIIAGANTEIQHVHSSQRWFYKDVQGTCMVSEILKHVYFHAMTKGMNMCPKNIRNFNINLGENFNERKFTYQQSKLKDIKKIFNERLDLVSISSKTESRLRRYFPPN